MQLQDVISVLLISNFDILFIFKYKCVNVYIIIIIICYLDRVDCSLLRQILHNECVIT